MSLCYTETVITVTFIQDVLGSQNNDREILTKFLEHLKTGKPLPKELENLRKYFAPAKAGSTAGAIQEIEALLAKQACDANQTPAGPAADISTEAEATAPTDVEKKTTVFPRTAEGYVHAWDYQWRGFIKEALFTGIELGVDDVKPLIHYSRRKVVDSVIHVKERVVLFYDPEGKPITQVGVLQRPLRGETPKGDRVCLVASETIPAGTRCQFTLLRLTNFNPKSKWKLTDEGLVWCLDYGSLKGYGQWRGGGYGRFTYTLEEPKKAS